MERSSRTGAPRVPLFPLFADLRGRGVLVVGGGAVARRKVDALLEAGARVAVVARTLEPALQRLADAGAVTFRGAAFEPAWLDGAWLVVAASDDHALNRRVARVAADRRIFLNAVDDARLSTFHVPARVRRGLLQIAISTAGAAPVLARRLRRQLEARLDESVAGLVEQLALRRARIRRRLPDAGGRRRFFERLLDGDWSRLVRAGADREADAIFEHALDTGEAAPRCGSVILVGAGPGDPGLLTLHALHALDEADVVVHDRLVDARVLERARRDAERIDVGKRVGEDHAATQARIHDLLVRHARAGKRVVRLQGGDPLVFGRGGEELEFLRAHGVPCRVVPGITAALAAAAAAQVALTDRRHAGSVALLAARGNGAVDPQAWAEPRRTLAVYMGVGALGSLSRTLVRHGRDPRTPCVLVENASLPTQRVLAGTLAGIPGLARAQGVRAPALLIIGEVAAQARNAIRHERCRRPAAIADAA